MELKKTCLCPEGHEPLDHKPGTGEAVVLGRLVPLLGAAATINNAAATGRAAAALGFGRRLLESENDCYCRKSPPKPPPGCTCKKGWVPLVDDLKHLGSQVGGLHACDCC